MASTLKINTLTGVTTAGSIAVTGEGNSTTTNLQQGLAKAWSGIDADSSVSQYDSFNIASITDTSAGLQSHNLTNSFTDTTFCCTASCNGNSVENFGSVEVQNGVGLGAGLAIQGMLANYAAGFTIIITRPFVVGDTIRVRGVAGVVDQVMLPYTILIDEDNVHIQIPNKLIVGEILHNSAENMLIELEIGVAYSSKVGEVIDVIRKAVETVDGVSEEKSPAIGVDNFGDSSINFGIRVWAPAVRHFEVRYALNQAIFNALQQHDIEIPFPQREVRMLDQ